jgi:hypothetical protein
MFAITSSRWWVLATTSFLHVHHQQSGVGTFARVVMHDSSSRDLGPSTPILPPGIMSTMSACSASRPENNVGTFPNGEVRPRMEPPWMPSEDALATRPSDSYSAYRPDLQGCVAAGATIAEIPAAS